MHAHLEQRANLGYHFWGLLTLFLWMKRWGIQPPQRSQTTANTQRSVRYRPDRRPVRRRRFSGCCFSPPSLMDDVDAVQAQIARNMLDSGDWVTARLDGVAYLEKSPLKYWMMAVSYMPSSACTTGRRGFRWRSARIVLCWLTCAHSARGRSANARGSMPALHSRRASGCCCSRAS